MFPWDYVNLNSSFWHIFIETLYVLQSWPEIGGKNDFTLITVEIVIQYSFLLLMSKARVHSEHIPSLSHFSS